MEKDDIIDLIENSKNDSIDEEFHEFYLKTLNSLPKKKKHNKLIGLVASIALVTIISTYTIAFAGNIPIIENIKNYFYAPDEYVKYAKNVDTIMTYDNYSVNVHDIMFDDNFIIYSYTISTNDGKTLEEDMLPPKIDVGIHIDHKYWPEGINGIGGSMFNEIRDSDNQVTFVAYYVVKELQLPNQIEIALELNDECNTKKSIKLQLDKSQSNSHSKEVKLDKEVKIPEGSIYYDSISFSPFGAVFFSQDRGDWCINGSDPYYFALFDENGKQLSLPSTSVGYNYEKKVTDITKEITADEYKGHKSITIATYDSRTGNEVEGSAITIPIPDVN